MTTQQQQPTLQQLDPKLGWQDPSMSKTIPGKEYDSTSGQGGGVSNLIPSMIGGQQQQQPQQPQQQSGYIVTQVTQTPISQQPGVQLQVQQPQSQFQPMMQQPQQQVQQQQPPQQIERLRPKLIQLAPDDAVEYTPSLLADAKNDPANSPQYHIGETPPVANMRKEHKRLWGFGLACIRGGTLDLTGPCVMPRNLNVFILVHGATYDLSMAHFVHPISYINVFVVLGAVNIFLPRGVRVENSDGCAIVGNFSGLDEYSRADSTQLNMLTPVVRITGLTILGGVRPEINKAVNPLVIVSHKMPPSY
jgi:hypothetical protein